MANEKQHELQEFLPTEEDESNERQEDATSGQKDGCDAQAESIGIQLAEEEEEEEEEEESDDLNNDYQAERRRKCNFEANLLQTIGKGKFEEIEELLTPRALQQCRNSLLISMKVSYKLRKLADVKGPDEVRLKRLANSVEEFTNRLLDPLKTDPVRCNRFGKNCLDNILNDAIGFEQKKLFTHPAVHSEMNRKWDGRELMEKKRIKSSSWLLKFLNIWCLFDLVFSPMLLAVFSLLKNKRKGNQTVAQLYLDYLESPYYKFVRDTLSYIILLFLHFALCLSPSTIAFSGLEWSILVFFSGRYLVELKQIWGIKQWLKRSRSSRCCKIFSLYLSDSWNKLDFVSLVIYSVVLTLRIITWVIGGSVTNNRALVIAGYLYSFNTFCLTLRAFGHVMEQSKDVGTIQIALFTILKDIRTVFWQFMAVIVAFSMAITKIYMSEKSFIANKSDRHKIACNKSGFSCWWTIVLHLGWSLLDQSEESDPMVSVDLTSEVLAKILYAIFLIMGVILLINMLIALLSNTYQKTAENSVMEWSFKRAVTIQTYDGYDPIPVPLNIIYRIFIIPLRLYRKFKKHRRKVADRRSMVDGRRKKDARRRPQVSKLDAEVNALEENYFAEHGDIFPVTDDVDMKVDLLVGEIERMRQDRHRQMKIMSQILTVTFQSQSGDQAALCTGLMAWHCHPGIRIEGPLLAFEKENLQTYFNGARYRKHFSPEFPHFEVTIVETGKRRCLGIGIVNEKYDTSHLPGWDKESIGYHTDDGKIFHNQTAPGRETEGPAMARQGDRIRCTVMFENKQERHGRVHVPVFFTLNGRKIIIRGEESNIFMDFHNPLFPFIGLTKGCSVLAKMCAKEDVEHSSPQLKEIKADLADVGKHFEDVKSDLADVRGSMCSKENLEDVKKATRCLEEKLDALLAKLSEKE